MPNLRRWVRGRVARTFMAVLLLGVVTPSIQACPMPMLGVTMAYAEAEMPEGCAGLSKQACLVAYVQSDQVSNSDNIGIASHAAVSCLTPAAPFTPDRSRVAASEASVHAGAPPPRLLFCRILE